MPLTLQVRDSHPHEHSRLQRANCTLLLISKSLTSQEAPHEFEHIVPFDDVAVALAVIIVSVSFRNRKA